MSACGCVMWGKIMMRVKPQFITKNEYSVYAKDRFEKCSLLFGSCKKHSPMLKKMFSLQEDAAVNEGWMTTYSRRD